MGRKRIEIFLATADDTFALGKKLAALTGPNSILALSGDLGAGKTTFVKGLAAGLQIDDDIVSPTYVYLNLYDGRLPLFHFDLYRLSSKSDFEALGFSEYFSKEGICAIEWPERIELPASAILIEFQYDPAGRRAFLAAEDPNLLYCLAN